MKLFGLGIKLFGLGIKLFGLGMKLFGLGIKLFGLGIDPRPSLERGCATQGTYTEKKEQCWSVRHT